MRATVGLHSVSLYADLLPELPGIVRAERVGSRFELLTADADQLVRDLVASGTAFSGLQVRPTSLEEAFLALTSAHAPAVCAR